jgi:effector-binding domain-containing protein
MELVNLIVFLIYLASLLILAYFLVKNNINKRKLLALYIQGEMDRYALGKKIEELSNKLSTLELSESDGFIKFISQSRDWAFEYIEEVQSALAEFDNDITPALDWYKSFGMVLGESAHTDILKKISEAYDKLKSVLPENGETPNN